MLKYDLGYRPAGRAPAALRQLRAREPKRRLPEQAMLAGHEQVVLSALMHGRLDLPVTEQDFGSQPNRAVFIAIKAVGQTRGWLAVKDELKRRHALEQVGGEGRLIDLHLSARYR
jgi:replicative DNA helicase